MATDTSSLQTLYDAKQPTPKLAKSMKEYAEKVDYYIDTELPSIKLAVEAGKAEMQQNGDFTETEIDVADAIISKIDGAIGV